MAKKKESTMQWKVDIADLKKSMKEAKTSLSLANAEFKASTAGMKDWKNSAEGVEAKLKQLKSTLDSQKSTLENLNKQYEIIAKELGADSDEAKKLQVQILNQKAAIEKTTAEITRYNTDLDRLQKEEAEANTELGKLTKTISEQESQLEGLRKEYKNAVLTYGENSKEAKALATQIEDLSGELSENKKRMAEVDKAADELEGSFEEATESAKDAGDGFTIVKGVLADLAATAIKAVVQGLKDLAGAAKEAWQEFDAGTDTIIKLTGATGEAAAQLQESYKNVAKSVKADMTDVGKAIGEVSTRFGASGGELEDLSTLFLKFSQITDSDVLSSIDDVQKAMSAYGLNSEATEGFLDRLAATAQATGVTTDKLTSGLVSNATAFQEMGLSVDQAVALMGQLEVSGANSETVLNGMRKALKSSATEGISINDALKNLQKTIENNASSTEGLTAAYDVFGKSGDQIYGAIKNGTLNFNDLAKAADNVSGTVENTYEATQDAGDKIGLAIQGAKVELGATIDDILTKYQPQIEKGIQAITRALEKLIPKISKAVSWVIKNGPTIMSIINGIVAAIVAMKATAIIMSVVSAFKTLFLAVQMGTPIMAALNTVMAANPIGIIIGLIAGLVAAFATLWATSEDFRNFFIGMWEAIKETVGEIVGAIVEFFQAAWEGIKEVFALVGEFFDEVFTAAWDAIKAAFETAVQFFKDIWDGIKKAFEAVVEFFTEIFTNAWNAIKEVWNAVTGFFTDIWEGVKKAFDNTVSFFSGIFSDAWEGIKSVWNAVKDFFQDIWDGIKEVFSGVTDWFTEVFQGAYDAVKAIFDTLVEVIKAPINLIIDGINLFIRGLNKIKIPSWVPGVGGYGLDFEEIPNLERGGILKKGQIGLLEGNGTEAVIPLDRNKAWISALASSLRQSLMTEGVIGGSTEVNNNYNYTQVINSPKAVDRLTLYRQTNSLLFTAQVRAQNA